MKRFEIESYLRKRWVERLLLLLLQRLSFWDEIWGSVFQILGSGIGPRPPRPLQVDWKFFSKTFFSILNFACRRHFWRAVVKNDVLICQFNSRKNVVNLTRQVKSVLSLANDTSFRRVFLVSCRRKGMGININFPRANYCK